MFKSALFALPVAVLLAGCVGGSSDTPAQEDSARRYILGLTGDHAVDNFLDNKDEEQSKGLKDAETYLTTAHADAALKATDSSKLSGEAVYRGGYFATTGDDTPPGEDQSMTGVVTLRVDFGSSALTGSIGEIVISDSMKSDLNLPGGALDLEGTVTGNKFAGTLEGILGPIEMSGTFEGDFRGETGDKALGSATFSEEGGLINWLGIFSASVLR